ncbi:hypothetical protein LQF61_08675 [Tetragenococcus koreensis]|uniref:EF0163 family protein n=1 Tax=Tetragenococcus koreensis TaxID=290335 RepID=UPI001F2715D3|nr:EF0163 family protein [Tetragenococcus koreensis]MCF1585556.1 hypothetical protein [Tetragenococcus koreensis]MCF1615102.1 hypothetical protein [Tetragenococcus koreensis]MCF1620147.1 hypothetical protein [Tetragenococcus koreensis]MCF1624930.1 hypothetical protein [Tetragenococcus koreensis]MCF1629822.1 hypothetical protein [Tetragenococcus koreensis]
MRKRQILLWVAGIILFVISVFYLIRLSQREDDFFLEETTEAISETSEITTNSTEQNTTPQTILESFGENWLNFSSITERNQQVKDYMTEDAIKNSQLDSESEEERESTGMIKTITQDIEHPQKYILLGEETTQGETEEVILEIDLTDDPSPKISHFEFNYKE